MLKLYSVNFTCGKSKGIGTVCIRSALDIGIQYSNGYISDLLIVRIYYLSSYR